MNKTEQNPTLSAKQLHAIAALLACPTVETAMKKAGVSRTTFYAWLRTDDAFREELETRRRETYEASLQGLQSLASAAVTELHRLLRSRTERVRFAACRLIIDAAFTAHQHLDIEQRLGELERCAERDEEGQSL